MRERNPCVFCGIALGFKPASVVYGDDSVIAFLDIHPRNPGHIVVIPVAHYACLVELPEGVGARMFAVAQRVAGAIYRSELRCEGISLGLADGAAAGQEVSHCHLHVRPRLFGDAQRAQQRPTRAELHAIAAQLRACVSDADR